MSQPQLRDRKNTAGSAGENAASRKDSDPPGMSGPGNGVVEEEREITKRTVAAIAAQITTVEGDLRGLETRLDGASLAGTEREKLRSQRRELRQRLEDLREDHEDGHRRLEAVKLELQQIAVQGAHARRVMLHKQGAEVATEIRKVVHSLDDLFHRWRQYRDESRLAVDVVRSIAPDRVNELPTFSYACGVDATFEAVISQVCAESHKKERELAKRVTLAVGQQ